MAILAPFRKFSSLSLVLALSLQGISSLAPLSSSSQAAAQETAAQEAAKKEDEFAPKQDMIPVAPPANAIVLFDGSGPGLFVSMKGEAIDWPIVDGTLESKHAGSNTNHIVSKLHFRDADIHVEFMTAEKGHGNSGVYIHGNYEMQIYNSFGKKDIDESDIGSLYGFHKPLVNAGRKVGEWQVYDIRYKAPRRNEAGKITEPGSVTAWLNGQKVQDGSTFEEPRSVFHPFRHGTTDYLKKINEKKKKSSVGPLFLQDHSSPARFRNVWVVPLDDQSFIYE